MVDNDARVVIESYKADLGSGTHKYSLKETSTAIANGSFGKKSNTIQIVSETTECIKPSSSGISEPTTTR